MDLRKKIRVISNYPVEGISFKDITTLLKDQEAFHEATRQMIECSRQFTFDKVIAPEARGFMFGPTIAYEAHKGFVPVRKPGKLPAPVFRQEYELEYGTDFIEIHQDAIQAGDRVLIIDDLLATGGTSAAIAKLVEKQGANVAGCLYLIELSFLDGRKELNKYKIESILKY